MRSIFVSILVLAVAVTTGASAATPGAPAAVTAYVPTVPPSGVIPAGVTSYATSEELTLRVASEVVHSRTGGDEPPVVLRRASAKLARYDEPSSASAAPERRHKYLPVILSALVPGAGEIYLGYEKRGIALMAMEAGAWAGYFYKRNQGLDTRTEYEHYADVHWDMRRWIDHHYFVYPTTGYTLEQLEEDGRASSGSGVWPGYSPWVPKSADKQHYYENIGKYDWYVSGWDDYVPGTSPDDLAPGEVFSEHREHYRDLRGESNDQLDAATRFTYLSITARVVSLVQTTLLVTRASRDSNDGMAQTDNHWMFSTRARGRDASEVALEYWFK